MTKRDVLKSWADRWRSLAAWGAPLPMSIEILDDKGRGPLGKAWSYACSAIVYDTGHLPGNLKTILHELAHLAAPNYVQHELPWRRMFVRAACEALGARVEDFELDVDLLTLNNQVEDAVKAWLDRSGQAVVLKAIGVL